MTSTEVRAADHIVDQLVAQGVTHVFGVPGESYLPVLDAMHGRDADIQFVTCRQEGGAAMAADAHGKLTGRPGICMVTRGPGASNAAAGLHVAHQDSTPMILFIGQVARNMIEREAFQEVDYRQMFGKMAKWVAEIDDPSRIQEYVSRAFRTAMSGRPGPVVLSMPEDMLYETIKAPPPPRRIEAPAFQPATDDLDDLKDRLSTAERPLVIVGGGGWTAKGIADLQRFAETQDLPVAVSFRCQSLMNNDHQNYVGHFNVAPTPYLRDAVSSSDLLVLIGPRMGEITTNGYTLLDAPVPKQNVVHVYPQPEEIGRVFEPDLALVSDSNSFCAIAAGWPKLTSGNRAGAVDGLRRAFEDFNNAGSLPDDNLAAMFSHLADAAPEDAIICNGAGNYAGWMHRFYRFRGPNTQLAPTSGSMGYGLPAAVAASVAAPDKEVFAVAGDGCFLMTCQEMATAAQYDLNLTLIIVNNGRYGTIRAHQEREFPGRVSGTNLINPDFCALARSFGASATQVEGVEDFSDALKTARSNKGIHVIEILQDPGMLAPGKRLSPS